MANTSKNKPLAKNTIYLYIRMFFAVFINLYTSRLVLEYLGVEDYGVYNVVGGIVSLMMFGVTVDNNVLIVAGSVVTHSVPYNVVIVGNPVHVICSFDGSFQNNQKNNVSTKGLDPSEKNIES